MDLKLATMAEDVPIPAYVFRAVGDDYVLVAVNAVARVGNPDLAALVGTPMAHLYADQPQVLADAARCIAERRTVRRDVAVRRHDRIEANQSLHLVFTFHAPDHLILFTVARAEPTMEAAALRESEARYRSLVASLPDGVLLRGPTGHVLACNERAAELFGQPSTTALLGRIDVLAEGLRIETPDGQPVTPDASPSRRVLETGEPIFAGIYAFRGLDRPPRWIRASASPIRGPDGAVAGSVTVFADETDRVTAERAVAEAAARLEMALDAARMGTWEFEPGTGRGEWAPRVYGDFGLVPRGATRLEQFFDRLHPDDLGLFRRLLDEVVAAGDGHVFEHEYRIVGDDGVTRWARVRGRREARGERVRLSGTIVDITERRALEEELRRAQRLETIGRLAGGLAHDFNNLLAAMLGAVELLEDVVPPAGIDDLATVRHGAERARDLTAQLLAFARKQPVALTTFDLAALVAQAERLLLRLVGPDIELVLALTPGAAVHADAAQLEQVLVNLVVNAREAMSGGGRVSVRVAVERRPAAPGGDQVLLEVADQGTGMDADTQRRVFDPFFTTKSAGTGLGLASSYGVVQQHGGDIEIDSAPGRGTRFRVWLPRVASPLVGPVTADAAVLHAVGTVLVVDDDELVRATAGRMLRSLGYEVLLAGCGDEAIALVAGYSGPLDAVLCDVAMPGLSGPDVMVALQGLRPGLRGLFVSGYPGESLDVAGVPGTAFLAKPYSRAELGARMRALLGRA